MSEAPLKATLKGGAGYEAPWLTIDGNTPEELYERLVAVAANEGKLLATLTEVAEQLRAAHAVAAGLGQSAPPAQSATVTQAAAPAAAAPPPAGTGRTCPHGIRVERSGTGSRGSWTGYFCPLAKGDPNQCKPEWK